MEQEKDYYSILGVNRNASQDEIKKAYKKQALRWHPDRNRKNEEAAKKKFQEVSEAFEVLNDPEKRNIYDRFGIAGLRGNAGQSSTPNGFSSGGVHFSFGGPGFQSFSFSDASNLFERIFGTSNPFDVRDFDDDVEMTDQDTHGFGFPFMGGMHRRSRSMPRSRARKQAPIQRDLVCTLEELYKGCTKRLRITRRIVQENGETASSKVLEVNVRPGWKAGTKVTFEREGDQIPGYIPADIVFVIQERPHPRFQREGNDLVYTQHISLAESLSCDFTVRIELLDGRPLEIPIDEVITPDSEIVIGGEGMPIKGDLSQKGDLKIKFKINFPLQIPAKRRRAIQTALSGL